MTRFEVSDLMLSSKSEKEWKSNADIVKKEFSGYPEWWFQDIIIGGIMGYAKAAWEK